jgi:hypothetical protein
MQQGTIKAQNTIKQGQLNQAILEQVIQCSEVLSIATRA